MAARVRVDCDFFFGLDAVVVVAVVMVLMHVVLGRLVILAFFGLVIRALCVNIVG